MSIKKLLSGSLLLLAFISLSICEQVTLDLTNYLQKTYDTVTYLKKGDNLEVLLKENPSTGYIWQIVPSDLK